MGKDEKEDSGFGFKDKAKAEETLRLLEQHDMNYRRLTVRGLLGRAKRVLSLTKAEEKIKNIKEAMEVFENWLAELEKNKEKKPEKEKRPAKKEEKKRSSSEKESASSSDDEKASLPSESVPGLGFKDAAAAEESLQVLAGRDPDYQLLAVKGLVGRAKRVLTCTRDETKLSNIKAAMAIFEKFIDEFDNLHLSRQNNPYLSAGIVRTAHKMAGDAVTDQQRAFLAAYSSVHGEYKRLRNVAGDGGTTWDIIRNDALKELKEKHANAKLFNEKDEPTKEHLELLVWAYSPEAAKVKKVVKETREERKSRDDKKQDGDDRKQDGDDRKHDGDDKKHDGDDKNKHGDDKNDRKRRSSARSDDESHSKKKKE